MGLGIWRITKGSAAWPYLLLAQQSQLRKGMSDRAAGEGDGAARAGREELEGDVHGEGLRED